MNNIPGEAAIPQQTQQQIAPDVTGQAGQARLFNLAVSANVEKKQLDAMLSAVAGKIGATTSGRVKSIATVGAKIAQKRLSGREYGIADVNDMLGERLVIKSRADLPKAKAALQQLARAGLFTINKSEQVTKDTYEAYHIDGHMPGGTAFEVQIMTPGQEAESLVNHSLRSVYGEQPATDGPVKLRHLQAAIVDKLPVEKQSVLSDAIKAITHQAGDRPVDPRIIARVLASVRGGEENGTTI